MFDEAAEKEERGSGRGGGVGKREAQEYREVVRVLQQQGVHHAAIRVHAQWKLG